MGTSNPVMRCNDLCCNERVEEIVESAENGPSAKLTHLPSDADPSHLRPHPLAHLDERMSPRNMEILASSPPCIMCKVAKRDGMKLGMNLDFGDGVTLKINRIGPGLITEWNEQHKDQVVRPGYVITSINGSSGNASKMLEVLNKAEMLDMNIDPCQNTVGTDHMASVIITKKEGAKLGLNLDFGDNVNLRVNSVTPGLIEDWNREHPDNRLEPGDLIQIINGKSGSAQELLEIINQAETLNMIIFKTQGTAGDPAVYKFPGKVEMA